MYRQTATQAERTNPMHQDRAGEPHSPRATLGSPVHKIKAWVIHALGGITLDEAESRMRNIAQRIEFVLNVDHAEHLRALRAEIDGQALVVREDRPASH